MLSSVRATTPVQRSETGWRRSAVIPRKARRITGQIRTTSSATRMTRFMTFFLGLQRSPDGFCVPGTSRQSAQPRGARSDEGRVGRTHRRGTRRSSPVRGSLQASRIQRLTASCRVSRSVSSVEATESGAASMIASSRRGS